MSFKEERRKLRRNCIKAKLKASRANTKSYSTVSNAWHTWLPLTSLQFFGKWQYLRGLAGAVSLVELWYLFSMSPTPCIVPSIWLILSNICWWSWRTLKAICTQPSSNPPGLALDTVVTLESVQFPGHRVTSLSLPLAFLHRHTIYHFPFNWLSLTILQLKYITLWKAWGQD